jgi:hypothetical protein
MASGIIATVSSTGSVAYTPVSDAQVLLSIISLGQSGGVTVNNVPALVGNYKFFVGAGQTLTVVGTNSAFFILSALEE